ncbi:MAG: hypothetical protein HOV67_20880 [Kribbellaceae bacterium]|nr:hypothetical protein [Kribbellaceae bacterium]
MADGDAWAGVVVKKSRAMYDGSNLYRKLEVQLDSGEVRDVKVKRELWKSLEVGDRLTKEADAEPTRVVI